MVERETHFNAMNPFWQAPFGYGTGVAPARAQPGVRHGHRETGIAATVGVDDLPPGPGGAGCGIGLEIYGFYLRVRITGWAPVTNMYETVIWVALVAAVLSFILEMIYRKVFIALAGSAVALLGTITAAQCPAPGPEHQEFTAGLAEQPLVDDSRSAPRSRATRRSRLAWMLGLIATTYYLTATYRRSPRFLELALPLCSACRSCSWAGLVSPLPTGCLALSGSIGDATGSSSSQPLLGGDTLFYIFAAIALIGETVTLSGLLALGGEVLNRMTFHPEATSGDCAGEAQRASSSTLGAEPCNRRSRSSSRFPTSSIVRCRLACC